MSLDRHLTNHGHDYRFIVTTEFEGWDVREENDAAVLRRVHHHDWHRVELETELFEIRALALKREGWSEA